MEQVQERRLIIGLGSGRSGTTSLAKFLNAQPSSFFVHEGLLEREHKENKNQLEKYNHALPWKKDARELENFLDLLREQSEGSKFYGSVGFYFLPYIEEIIKKHPQVKFIKLIRNREDVVRSFSVHSGKRNMWMNHDGKRFAKDPLWDDSFPKFEASSKEEAIGKYWDMYRDWSRELENRYPDRFKIVDIELLNTTNGMNAILDFVGYPKYGRVLRACTATAHTNPKPF